MKKRFLIFGTIALAAAMAFSACASGGTGDTDPTPDVPGGNDPSGGGWS